MMKYVSTRGYEEELTGAQAIIQGIAPDKGLYVPKKIPELPFDLKDMVGKTYKEIAKPVIGAFFDDFTEEELTYCVDGAYDDKFEASNVVPIKKASGVFFLELFHGKTAAFKDMALSILPYLLTTSVKKENEEKKICILTATSGDTGKAALEGFADVDGTEIIVFYPQQGVSRVQERQMITQEGKNTHVFAIKGNFDDAQNGVKKIFNDSDFAKELELGGIKLSSANSINIGRLVPQVAYYVYGYIKLLEKEEIKLGEEINVVVPTGNFGNILAAFYAKTMGIPIGKFICASNENKVLTDFFNEGMYDINRDFYLTNSPSMDILISSNLERFLYEIYGGDTEAVKDLMESLETKGKYSISEDAKMRIENFYGGYADTETTVETIGKMYKDNKYLMDTHTAVAYKVYDEYMKQTRDKNITLIASTASAYKFAESVAKAIGIGREGSGFEYIKKVSEKTEVPIPKGLQNLEKKEICHRRVIEISEMKKTVSEALQ